MSSNFCHPMRVSSLQFLTCATLLVAFSQITISPLDAHDEFKEVLQQRYRLRSVSCKACHTDNKDKKIRNAFGKLLHGELKDKKLTERYLAAKEKGEEAEEKFEKKMLKEFLIALEAVEKKPITFVALMEAGLLNGTRLDNNQVDADALTIKTLSDAEVDAIKVNSSDLVEGEIQEMSPEKEKPATPEAEKDDANPEPSGKSETSEAQPNPDAKSSDSKSEPPLKSDDDTKSE